MLNVLLKTLNLIPCVRIYIAFKSNIDVLELLAKEVLLYLLTKLNCPFSQFLFS